VLPGWAGGNYGIPVKSTRRAFKRCDLKKVIVRDEEWLVTAVSSGHRNSAGSGHDHGGPDEGWR
jgi:hypothetical protein